MSILTLDEVNHVARLARLRLTEDEQATLTVELNVILGHFEVLQRLDTENIPPTAHALPQVNVLRDDICRPSLPREELLGQAAEARDDFFVVARVIDTGEAA